ncbi:unnamed protein product [Sphenostylis stenocarpa]|uniref:Uncharacterized protein n=1 Tax=Sphenostylis stenocarpa TaxID=92480 RepID=A0AA86T4A9_9FABA|nr:unnamed protein product [Sphenostylis stenocarpa]
MKKSEGIQSVEEGPSTAAAAVEAVDTSSKAKARKRKSFFNCIKSIFKKKKKTGEEDPAAAE